jgi:DNA-binding LacI/PurR family transcriptional regulator
LKSTSTGSKDRAFLPAYRHIENEMRAKVNRAEWPAGMMLPSRDRLAKEYNVAIGTIQRAVENLVSEGVLWADPRRGTFVTRPNGDGLQGSGREAAPSLRAIAALLMRGPRSNHPFAQAISQGINQALQGKETRLVIFNTTARTWNHLPEMEREALQAVVRDGISGVIMWYSGDTASEQELARLNAAGVPMVFVDRYPTEFDCDFVGIDNYQSACTAMEYLLRLGHRRIGLFSTVEEISSVLQRDAGYRDSLAAADIVLVPEYIQRLDYFDEQYDRVIDRYLSLDPPPTAYLVINDDMAYRFIAVLQERGIRVPDDVAVVSFDDIDRFSPRPPFLTTIHQPLELIGQRAAELLLERMQNPYRPGQARKHILLPTHLVERHTVKKVP